MLWNRMAMAAVLYAHGAADYVLVSGGKPRAGVSEAERMLQIAETLGIPRDRIIVEAEAETSEENGWLAAELLRAHGLTSALLVTDYAHMMYALPVFTDA